MVWKLYCNQQEKERFTKVPTQHLNKTIARGNKKMSDLDETSFSLLEPIQGTNKKRRSYTKLEKEYLRVQMGVKNVHPL